LAAVRGLGRSAGVEGTDNPEMVSWVGGTERPRVCQHQFDERQLWSDQSVFGRGMVQHLVEHTLIAGTGEHPIAAGDDVSAEESLQRCSAPSPSESKTPLRAAPSPTTCGRLPSDAQGIVDAGV
jgi:hypothetical protein